MLTRGKGMNIFSKYQQFYHNFQHCMGYYGYKS